MDNELRCLLHSHYPFSIIHYSLSKLFFQKLPRIACSASGYFFRCTYRYDISAFVSAFRSEVDYIIGTFDNIHIMFDDDNAVSPSDECVEGIQQLADVVEVQSGGWFVKNKQGRVGFLLTQVECQLHTLVFATG